jgi:hypothetical protein
LKKFLFADLDDTLFQTLEKCPGPREQLRTAALLPDGRPNSFTTAAQRAFLDFALDGMTVIPATARNLDQFNRVDLPFTSYAVINYGGVVLRPDRSVDEAWLEALRPAMLAALPGLRELAALIDEHGARSGIGHRTRLVEDFGTPFYICVKDPDKQHARLARIEDEVVAPWIAAGSHDYFIHRNGNNIAVLPKALNKANAVRHETELLRARHGAILTFGMGDSRSDARFMAACDYAIVPRGTQLARLTMEAL